MRNHLILMAAALFSGALSSYAQSSVLTDKDDFNSKSLMTPEYRNASPEFSMHQSYSLSFTSGNRGSFSSGLYLNTLSYRLSAPLTLSADVGFYTPIYSTFPGPRQYGPASPANGSSLIFPRLGLEYHPSENFSMDLDLVNERDAWKAYGSPFAQPFWNRLP